jgi:hypothetical protein
LKKKLALIHTSMVFVKVETIMLDIFAELMPDVELINIVDDTPCSSYRARDKIVRSD